jgi:hypothetical protein
LKLIIAIEREIMFEIPLTQGKVTLVDNDDLEYLLGFKWHIQSSGDFEYAARAYRLGNKIYHILMHREILLINNISAPNDVDHMD